MFDVAVIGAGPAGCTAAKRCAEKGLQTVILEKKRLPRDKVCSGMIIGRLAQALIHQEFGEIPEEVLCRPSQLKGYMFHGPDVDDMPPIKFDFSIPLTWRRNLDFWLTEKARSKGVNLYQGAAVAGIKEEEGGFLIEYEQDGQTLGLEAKFIIGADGGTSIVRKTLFPQLKVHYNQAYEEWYPGSLALDAEYFHWLYLLKSFPGGFAVHQKDGFIILEFGGTVQVPKERVQWAKEYLAGRFGFDSVQEPVHRSACTVARLAVGLGSGNFLPAEKNVLLIGEAGGFVLPITGEGIGTCLKSGLLAAESISEALRSDGQADGIYLNLIKPVSSALKEYSSWMGRVEAAAKDSSGRLLETLVGAHEASLKILSDE
jgi:flavin-dependent dehydrogenase